MQQSSVAQLANYGHHWDNTRFNFVKADINQHFLTLAQFGADLVEAIPSGEETLSASA